MGWVVLLPLLLSLDSVPDEGLRVDPPQPTMQELLIRRLQIQLWGTPREHQPTNTCQNALYSSCGPVTYST